MPARETDPLLSFHFALEVSDKINGFFTEVGGLGSESEVVDHKVVKDGKQTIMKIPGRVKWTDVTLKRGVTAAMDIWEWRDKVVNGDMKAARAGASIIMYDQSLKPIARWDMENAWPSKVTGPNLKADSNEFGVEEIVIVHEGMKRTK
jgi:phage tail-like protein